MEFYKYLLELYEEKTEGASGYDGGDTDDNFRDDLSDFFDRLLIYDDEVQDLANQYGSDIITAAMRLMAMEHCQPADYIDLTRFVYLAFSSIEEEYYDSFKNVFLNK